MYLSPQESALTNAQMIRFHSLEVDNLYVISCGKQLYCSLCLIWKQYPKATNETCLCTGLYMNIIYTVTFFKKW